jgi:hypothetical protein
LSSALNLGRRASVAVWIAVMAPGLIMAMAMAVEVGAWAAAKASVQRTADLSAVAGAANYSDSKNAVTAATFAARLAQMNINTGTTTALSWTGSCTTPCTSTCTVTGTESQASATVPIVITAEVILCGGLVSTSDAMLKVTVQQPIAAMLSYPLFSANATNTISASSTAELVSITGSPPSSPNAVCLLALGTSGNDITASGSADLTGSSCVIRSNSSMSLSGSADFTAHAFYVEGGISTSGSASVNGTKNTGQGTISDPFASNSAVQTAIATLSSGSGSSYSLSGTNTATISPGTYSSISVSGSANLTLSSGLYTVIGPVSVSGSATVTGSGVTIVTSGTVTLSGSGVITLTAPGTSPTSDAVSGFVLIGTGSGAWSYSGSGDANLTGVLYAPNAGMTFSGSSASSPSSCLEVVVKTASLSGSATLSAACSSYGITNFGATSLSVQSRLTR